MGFVTIKTVFTVTESSVIGNFTKSDFAFFFPFFKNIEADCYFGLVNLCCVISRVKYVRIGLDASVWMYGKKY